MEIGFGIFFLAFFTEGLTEYLFGKSAVASWFKTYFPLAIGITLAYFYAVDIPTLVGLKPTFIGPLVSGVLIGRGSNALNDIISYFVARKKALAASVE